LSWVVADSSFYICFLEDIEHPEYLLAIVERLDFMITEGVFAEVSKCSSFENVRSGFRVKHTSLDPDVSAVLRPLFSEAQWRRGEAEAIALGIWLLNDNLLSKLILDDEQARSFVERNVGSLTRLMTGTIGFIGFCVEQEVMTRDTALQILLLIEGSNFRVSGEVLSNVRRRIGESS
jgi:predicted nucleic acid-binding protein